MDHHDYLHMQAQQGLEEMEYVNPVQWLLDNTWSNNTHIADLSGLNSTTVRKIREGKTPTKAQFSALKFVWLKHVYRLHV